MVAARRIVHVLREESESTVWNWRGNWYSWQGYQWRSQPPEWVEDGIWKALENAQVVGRDQGLTPFSPTTTKVTDVARALAAIQRMQFMQVPVNLKDPKVLRHGNTITFRDVVYDVKENTTTPREVDWFDPCVLPVDYDMEAKCPTWLRCLDQWGEGNGPWQSLLKRWFGYCLMPQCRLGRWLLMYGRVRSGKGTITRVLQELVGRDGFFGTSVSQLSSHFGLQGLELARAICVHEVNRVDSQAGEKFAQVMKNIVGQDPMDIDRKYREPLHNVVINAKIILQSNEVPMLPNRGAGLSGKMLLLPFDVSFLNHEDPELIDKLLAELPGIAAWAAEGAKELLLHSSSKKWPHVEAAEESERLYRMTNNPMDHFLEDRFLPNPKGFVAGEIIWKEWKNWVDENDVRGRHVARNRITVEVCQQSTWDVRRVRRHPGTRGLEGLSLRQEAQDER
jgi:putative DNA primase/helicase